MSLSTFIRIRHVPAILAYYERHFAKLYGLLRVLLVEASSFSALLLVVTVAVGEQSAQTHGSLNAPILSSGWGNKGTHAFFGAAVQGSDLELRIEPAGVR